MMSKRVKIEGIKGETLDLSGWYENQKKQKLEEQERKWDDAEPLTVTVEVFFDKPVKRVQTNAAIPSHIKKHIYFEKSKKWKCYDFINEKPKHDWIKSEIVCNKH